MIEIKNVSDIYGTVSNLIIESIDDLVIDAKGLTFLPGLIDPHVHFRTPGLDYKEDWRTAAAASIAGGYTTVFDMPNTLPPTITLELLQQKKSIIDSQLNEAGIPLRYELFFGADKNHLSQIPLVKNACIGIKVFMGCSTGNLVIDDDESLDAVFKIAAHENLIVAVHAEDEALMKEQKNKLKDRQDYPVHSEIRNIEVATTAIQKAISLTKKYGTRLYILHVSSGAELELIKKAKAEKLPVYGETTPHHLFLNDESYATLSGKAVVNPPLRSQNEHSSLLQGIHDGTIDTIGSDHAPHLVSEKEKPYGQCPSGMPGIETTLPLLLNAYHEKKLNLEEIVSLTSKRAQDIFNLKNHSDVVLVDLKKIEKVTEKNLKTKCGWSPFAGRTLTGWPVCTIVNGFCFWRVSGE